MTRRGLFGWWQRLLPSVGILAVCLAAVEVFIDWMTWIELNESIVYPLPLVLAAMTRNRRLLWWLTAFLVGTVFAVYAVQIGPGVFSLSEHFFVNRVLVAVTVLVTAGMLHAWTRALDKLDEQGLALRAQNEQLDAANRELLRCQDEITRQNEELDRRRREAEDASGRKSQLLACAAHDIRSPLNAINLMAYAIGRTAGDPALAAGIPDLAQRMQANAQAMAGLISDILDVSALDSGRTEVHESEFSLNELLADECRRLLPLAEAKNLALTVEPAVPAIDLWTDRMKLTRVLSNLITNAIKFTDSGGVILSAGINEAGDVLVRVRDTGVGIGPDDLGRIFDEFAQVAQAGRDPTRGWGLGLAICRRLVELMGGAITVESQRNRGSTFSVRLPPSCTLNRSASDSECDGYRRQRTNSLASRCT